MPNAVIPMSAIRAPRPYRAVNLIRNMNVAIRKKVGNYCYIQPKQRGNILINDIKLGLQNTLAVENNPVFCLSITRHL